MTKKLIKLLAAVALVLSLTALPFFGSVSPANASTQVTCQKTAPGQAHTSPGWARVKWTVNTCHYQLRVKIACIARGVPDKILYGGWVKGLEIWSGQNCPGPYVLHIAYSQWRTKPGAAIHTNEFFPN